MEKFSLDKWLQDKSRKVITRNNIEVEIIHDSFPLVAIINGVAYNFDNDGKFQSNKTNHKYDLFFADEEPESIEIPFGAKDSEFVKDEYYIPEGCEARIEGNKVIIEKIQKEELTEFEKELNRIVQAFVDAHCYLDEVEIHHYGKGLLDLARKELLKDLPKWKFDKDCPACALGEIATSNKGIWNHGYFISWNDLEKLPKEE